MTVEPEARFTLERLLAPVSVDEFLERIWEREPRHVPRDESGYFADLLSIDDLDEVLEYGRLTPPGIRITSSGASVPPSEYLQGDGRLDLHAIRRLYAQGESIVLNGLERLWPAIGVLVQAMQSELSYRVETNAYLTPRGSQAFRPHYDTHDVIVLQLHGAKEWRVYDAPQPWPLPSATPDDPIDVAGRPMSLSIRLTAGDALYVPRGWIHEARSGPETSSLHLTLGIHPPTWYDLLGRALEISALQQPELRRALPVGFLHPDTNLVELEHQFERLWQVAREGPSLPDAVGSLHDEFIRRLRPPPDRSMIRTLDRVDDVDDHTKVIPRAGLQARLVRFPDAVGIQFATSVVRGPLHYEAAMVFVLDRTDVFIVADLPGLDADQRSGLARRLVVEGVLNLADGP